MLQDHHRVQQVKSAFSLFCKVFYAATIPIIEVGILSNSRIRVNTNKTSRAFFNNRWTLQPPSSSAYIKDNRSRITILSNPRRKGYQEIGCCRLRYYHVSYFLLFFSIVYLILQLILARFSLKDRMSIYG